MISQLTQHFWSRWSSEYLTSLQSRQKRRKHQRPVAVGDLVLIRSELTPPAKWPLARVAAIHPGSDGITRVVDLSTLSPHRQGQGGRNIRDSAYIRHILRAFSLLPQPTTCARELRHSALSTCAFTAPPTTKTMANGAPLCRAASVHARRPGETASLYTNNGTT